MPRHNHITRDIKPRGICPGCDEYHYKHSRELIEEILMGDPNGEEKDEDNTDETS